MIEVAVSSELGALRAGIVIADGLGGLDGPDAAGAARGLDGALAEVTAARREGLSEEQDAVRRAAREVLRHGVYKPTGRGKPASEYLIRAAMEDAFPRINPPVDVCNLISLKHLIPVSLWDPDRAAADSYLIRRGRPGEHYVFNSAGQAIELADLIVGCTLPDDLPRVNPVKDSMDTKTTSGTRRVASILYAPASAISRDRLETICAEYAAGLERWCAAQRAGWMVVDPGGNGAL
jgi:DNA/RNA-binding domain of Phe-tRNA-synthetase-like protein